MIATLLDVFLATALVLIAIRGLLARDLRTAAFLFLVFGLLLALVWVRLGATDVGMAEAAIGAGVTGALLLDASAQLQQAARRVRSSATLRWTVGSLSSVLGLVLAWSLARLPPSPGTATRMVSEHLGEAGVTHAVTGVLLAFRAYDTLLEVAVLFAAVLAVGALPPISAPPPGQSADELLRKVVTATFPIALIVAGYLLWAGATRTGGAFQGGAVLAGALLLARYAGAPFDPVTIPLRQRASLTLGLTVFILVGLAGALSARAVLAYAPGWAGTLILVIETALAGSIALSLVAVVDPTWRR